jgi:hypothetical protein
MIVRSSLILLLIVTFIHGSVAQNRRSGILDEPLPKGEGSITLYDGSSIKGIVTYNDNEGFVQVLEGTESHSYAPKRVIAFEFFDDALNRKRNFLSLEATNTETGQIDFVFFEILGEFENFAILTKKDRIQTEVISSGGGYNPATGNSWPATSSTVAYQTETVYFLNAEGKLEPYTQNIDREVERTFADSRTNKDRYVKKNLLEQYTGEHYPALQAYIDENKLKLKRKEDLILVIQEYKRLLGQ